MVEGMCFVVAAQVDGSIDCVAMTDFGSRYKPAERLTSVIGGEIRAEGTAAHLPGLSRTVQMLSGTARHGGWTG